MPLRPNHEEKPLGREDQAIRDALRKYAPPHIDKTALRNQMVDAISAPSGGVITSRRVFAVAAALLIAIGAWLYLSLSNTTDAAVRSIEFMSSEQASSFTLGEWRLKKGYLAVTPNDVKTRIQLQDSSIVICEPSTQIAFNYENNRVVRLKKGEVLVEVAKDEMRPFIVQTPLLDVEAVGTRFRVKIVP